MRCYPPQGTPPDRPIPAPTLRAPKTGRYGALINMVIEANGAWVAVTDPRTINGQTPKAKSTSVHSAAFVRHIKVKTTVQNGFLYIALVDPTAVVPA
jgi:hypothetical protein